MYLLKYRGLIEMDNYIMYVLKYEIKGMERLFGISLINIKYFKE